MDHWKKPFLEKITEEDKKKEFEEQGLDSIKRDYKQQRNKRVLFTFKRLFFVTKR